MSELDTVQRLAILEEQHRNIVNDIKEIKDTYKEDMQDIKNCLYNIETQTSTWKNVFWGISIAVTALLAFSRWLFDLIGFDIRHLFQGH